jgi:hypothetical protein
MTRREPELAGMLQCRAGGVPRVSVVNQYSFVWLSAAGVVMLAVVLAARRAPARQWLSLAALVLGLGVAYALLRPSPVSPDAALRLESSIGSGRPVLLELQSPY